MLKFERHCPFRKCSVKGEIDDLVTVLESGRRLFKEIRRERDPVVKEMQEVQLTTYERKATGIRQAVKSNACINCPLRCL